LALSHPSPNFGERRQGAQPDLIVLHYTAMPTVGAALERLCDPGAEVSAHYLIGRDGVVASLVDEEMRAWHAGAGAWGVVTDVNSRSIGIELDNDGVSPFSEPQMAALERLMAGVMGRWAIPPERVIGHSDMAPGRKIDPGRRFDWLRLARQGLASWPQASAGGEGAIVPEAPARSEAAFRDACIAIGYPSEGDLAALLDAFRARFRQQATGPLSARDIAVARLVVDPGADGS